MPFYIKQNDDLNPRTNFKRILQAFNPKQGNVAAIIIVACIIVTSNDKYPDNFPVTQSEKALYNANC